MKCPLVAPLAARDATLTMACLISTFSSVINGDPGLASDNLMRYLATYFICLAAVKGGAFDQPSSIFSPWGILSWAVSSNSFHKGIKEQ